MNLSRIVWGWAGVVGFALGLPAAEPLGLDAHLEPLRPWLGKTWKGEFKNSKPDKPVIDVARWERALNGKAVRILHSINDGIYGGETILVWDETKQSLTYHYFTTAGFVTQGTVRFKDGAVLTHEVVSGNANGVTEVRGQTEMRPDGTFQVKTEHFKDGKWTPGHEATYREDAAANVVFK
jgi:hypothetical protein